MQEEYYILQTMNRIACLVRQAGDADFDLAKIPLDDEDAFQVINDADSAQSFPFIDEELMYILALSQPKSISDIVYICVDIAVGDADNFEEGTRRSAANPIVASILAETQSKIYYREQIADILSQLGGMSRSTGHNFIKAAIDRDWTAVEGYRNAFLEVADKLDRDTAVDLINWLETAAQYARCKEHEISQATRIYQAAYLKAHYPCEFAQAVGRY